MAAAPDERAQHYCRERPATPSARLGRGHDLRRTPSRAAPLPVVQVMEAKPAAHKLLGPSPRHCSSFQVVAGPKSVTCYENLKINTKRTAFFEASDVHGLPLPRLAKDGAEAGAQATNQSASLAVCQDHMPLGIVYPNKAYSRPVDSSFKSE